MVRVHNSTALALSHWEHLEIYTGFGAGFCLYAAYLTTTPFDGFIDSERKQTKRRVSEHVQPVRAELSRRGIPRNTDSIEL